MEHLLKIRLWAVSLFFAIGIAFLGVRLALIPREKYESLQRRVAAGDPEYAKRTLTVKNGRWTLSKPRASNQALKKCFGDDS